MNRRRLAALLLPAALLAGCASVTATRILGDLKEAGVLDGSRGDYALVPSALQDAADKYVCEVI